jgi:hypothetical protein
LEYSGYLELFLWPHFSAAATFEHVASIAIMINEKGRESVPMWSIFEGGSDANAERRFGALFLRVLLLRLERHLRPAESDAVLQFVIHAFQSMECDLVRKVSFWTRGIGSFPFQLFACVPRPYNVSPTAMPALGLAAPMVVSLAHTCGA